VTEAQVRTVHLVALLACLVAAGIAVLLGFRAAELAAGRSLFETGRPAAEAVLMAVVALGLLAVVAFRPQTLRLPSLARTAATWTLLLVAGIIGLWQVAYRELELDALVGMPVSSTSEVEDGPDRPPAAGGPRIPDPDRALPPKLRVPDRGQRARFRLRLAAIRRCHSGDDRAGGRLPESIDTKVFEEAYRSDLGDETLIGWYFEATLRQAFDYTRYPLDRQDVWVRLWSPSAAEGAVLVPDVASYDDLDPAALPGIEQEIVSTGWQPYVSGFTYSLHSYNTRFGRVDAPFRQDAPELFFNLGIKRDYGGPLLKHLPFTLAIAGLLFGIMLLGTSDPDLRSRFGFQTLAVIATTGALLLTVVVEHNGIRETVSAGQISYIEVLPFTLYGLILLVTVNAIIRDRPDAPAFFDDRNNIWPVMLYWPVFVGILFVATYVVFFVR
jgi:hypothetical protein